MALARDSLALGYVPLDDHFAYTPTVHPVVIHEWGSGMLLYGLATHGGVWAFQAARLSLLALTTVACTRVAVARGATLGSLWLLALPAIVMGWIGLTAIRPQVFTVAFLALWLIFIEADRRGDRRWIGFAIAANLVWQNLHGGFVVGWGFLVLHALEQACRRRPFAHVLGAAVAMAVLVAINPYGFAYYPYLAEALTMSRELIGEWQPIWHANPIAFGVYLVSILVAVALFVRVWPRAIPGWPILATAAVMAANHERHVSIYALVWFAYVPPLLARTSPIQGLDVRFERPGSPLAVAAVTVSLALACVSLIANRPWELTVPGTPRAGVPGPYPVGAVEYLKAHHVRANLFTPFIVGAYVLWKATPDIKVSLDSRYEAAYPTSLLRENLDFYDAKSGWEATLAKYPTTLVLAPLDSPIAASLPSLGPWRAVYRDDVYVVFARESLPIETHGPLIGTLP